MRSSIPVRSWPSFWKGIRTALPGRCPARPIPTLSRGRGPARTSSSRRSEDAGGGAYRGVLQGLLVSPVQRQRLQVLDDGGESRPHPHQPGDPCAPFRSLCGRLRFLRPRDPRGGIRRGAEQASVRCAEDRTGDRNSRHRLRHPGLSSTSVSGTSIRSAMSASIPVEGCWVSSETSIPDSAAV